MILRATQFFGICYSDEVSEKEFFGKKFKVTLYDDVAVFSLELIKGLDFEIVNSKLDEFTFYEIEDVYLKNRLIKFLSTHSTIKKIKWKFGIKERPVKQLKLTSKGFLIKLI